MLEKFLVKLEYFLFDREALVLNLSNFLLFFYPRTIFTMNLRYLSPSIRKKI
jgi:hypothetical protein